FAKPKRQPADETFHLRGVVRSGNTNRYRGAYLETGRLLQRVVRLVAVDRRGSLDHAGDSRGDVLLVDPFEAVQRRHRGCFVMKPREQRSDVSEKARRLAGTVLDDCTAWRIRRVAGNPCGAERGRVERQGIGAIDGNRTLGRGDVQLLARREAAL